jgi:D-aspartate ligase
MNSEQVGAVVIGGEHPGLGIARSLGRKGIPICVIDDQHSVSQFSRYATRVVRVKDLRDEQILSITDGNRAALWAEGMGAVPN